MENGGNARLKHLFEESEAELEGYGIQEMPMENRYRTKIATWYRAMVSCPPSSNELKNTPPTIYSD